MHRIFFILAFLFIAPILAQDPQGKVSVDQSLFLRRVIDFWQEGEHEIVKKEVVEYLKKSPESSFNDYLRALMGDIYFKEKNYVEAIKYYKNISHPQVLANSFLSHLQCLYQENQYKNTAIMAIKALKSNKYPVKNKVRIQFLLADSLYRWTLNEDDNPSKQKALAQRAVGHYRRLLSHKEYHTQAVHALANLHNITKDYKEACGFYQAIAAKEQNRKEEFLFQAALLMSYQDKLQALSIYDDILALNGNRTAEANYNKLILLYETGNFAQIIASEEKYQKALPQDRASHLLFFLGRSCYHLKDFEKSKEYLKRFLKLEEGQNEQTKLAIVTLAQLASHTEDMELFDYALHNFEIYFPQDSQRAKILLSKAILEKKLGHTEEAKKVFAQIETSQILFDEQEEFLSQYALFCREIQEHELSRKIYKKLLSTFPKNKQYWSSLLFVTFHLAQDDANKQKELLDDLQQYLQAGDLATKEEKEEYEFLVKQCKFKLEKYEEVIDELSEWIVANPHSMHIAKAYFMVALSHHHLKKYDGFMYYAQKALSCNSQEPEQVKTLHSAYFNSYLELAKENENMSFDYFEKAADHLYQAQLINSDGIKEENLFWLVDHLFKKNLTLFESRFEEVFSKKSPEYAMACKAIELLENKLLDSSGYLVLDTEHKHYEPEVIKLADLYKFVGQDKKRYELLAALVDKYKQLHDEKWAHTEQANFALAGVYEKQNNRIKALEHYNQIVSGGKLSYLFSVASLRRVQLRKVLLPKTELVKSNPEVIEDLKHLKTLCLQRKCEQEPLHLEAAFEYVDLQCLIDEAENPIQKRLALLSKLKQQFLSEDDILSKTYHLQRNKFADKALLFDAYLSMMDIEMDTCRFQLEEHPEKKLEIKARLSNELRELKKRRLLVNDYLKHRYKMVLASLKKR